MREYPTALVTLGDPQGTLRAIRWVIQHTAIGEQHLVWAPGKQNLRHERAVEEFAKQGAVMTPRAQSPWRGGPVLAAWPDAKNLATLAQNAKVTALCVLAWADNDSRAWAAAVGPELLTPGGKAPTPAAALDPVVIQALKTLSVLVNHANQLAGSMDHRDAVAVLRTLRKGGYKLDAAAIYAWALANEWPSGGADRLRELATKIEAGVAVRAPGADRSLREDILQVWQQEAAQ